jgi:diguanylate cyclase (GGDEF)-like protein/PAS domain S-box-containing protein
MTADASVLWSVISGMPLRDAEGKTVGYRGRIVDSTARKQAELALRESEQKYRELFRHSMDAISLVSPGGLLLEANQAYLDLFGYTEDDIGVLNVEEHYVNPEDRTRLLESIAKRGEMVDDEVRLRKRNGIVMDCVRTVVVRRDAHGHVIGDQSVIRDITKAKRAEEDLRESEQQYRQLFEQSMDAIYVGTPEGRIIDVNKAWLNLFGYTRRDVRRLTALDLYADPAERESFLRKMSRRDHVFDEVHFKKKDGTVFDCERSVTTQRGIRGVPVVYQGIFRDVTERNRARAELERLARFDMLTGALNRRSTLGKLTEWVVHTRRYGGNLSVVMMDIDHFKQVNDQYGHQVGDRVLADVAGLLHRSVRTTDFVGRYGGEEFLIVLPRTDATGAAVMAERMRAHLQGTTMHDAAGGTFGVTASFGAAQWRNEDVDSLVGRADQALYAAKAAGRNRVEVAATDGSGH